MPTISGISWTAAAGSPEGHYIWAGPVSGLYPYRSSAIVMPTLSGSVTVPSEGTYYVAVTGYTTVDGDIVYGPYSDEETKTTGASAPVGTPVLSAR